MQPPTSAPKRIKHAALSKTGELTILLILVLLIVTAYWFLRYYE